MKNNMNATELRAEAIYQKQIALKSGVIDWHTTEDHGVIIRYGNGTYTLDNGNTIQYELNGRIMTYFF